MGFYLHDTPGNPAPPAHAAGYFTADDGMPLRYALFRATMRPHFGTIVLLPGRNETIEKYYETITDLTRMGYDIAILDWRGQGFSGRQLADPKRGHVRSFDDYAGDLRRFLDAVVLPDCRSPYHLLAHSMGALVALVAAPALSSQIDRMVLSAPLLDFAETPLPRRWLRRLTGLLSALGFGGRYLHGRGDRPQPFATNVLTSDPARFARNRAIRDIAPEFALGGPTIGWAAAACRAIDRVRDPEYIATLHVPMLLVAAGADRVVSNRAIEDFARRPRAGATLTVDGARHELMQEIDLYREPFLAAVHAFLSGEDAVPDVVSR